VTARGLLRQVNEMAPTDLDALTRSATAFPSYAELVADMTRTGYFPTLSRHSKAQRELGRVLESEHRRVFWTK